MARRTQLPAHELADEDLLKELRRAWRKRPELVFEGDVDQLERHTERMQELEGEYATRHTDDVQPDAWRTRAGARARAGQRVDGGGVPREAVLRARAADREDGEPSIPGAGEGYERRQGRRRRETFEKMQQGKPFSRHTIGTTSARARAAPQPKRRHGALENRNAPSGSKKEWVENPDLNRRTRGSGGGKGGERGAEGKRSGGRRKPKSGAQG